MKFSLCGMKFFVYCASFTGCNTPLESSIQNYTKKHINAYLTIDSFNSQTIAGLGYEAISARRG